MNILFICKYNRFRSKVAEAYFKSKNKNKKIQTASAAVIKVDLPLSSNEKRRNSYIKKKYGISFETTSRSMSYKLLQKADKIIVTANDVPQKIFDYKLWKNKVEIWNIPDVFGANKRNIDKSVKLIITKVNELVRGLK